MRMTALLIFTCLCVAMALAGGRHLSCQSLIQAPEGSTVTLQSRLHPGLNLSPYTVDVRKPDLHADDNVVHSYRDRRDHFDPQMVQYKDRTTLNHEDLLLGIVTLQISSVTLSDGGPFRFFVPKMKLFCVTNLTVVSKDQQNRTKRHDSTTTGPPPEEEPESEDRGAETSAVLIIVLPVVGVLLLLLLVAAFLLLWKCGVIEKCMRMLRGERQQEYERPRDIELQQRK
ncbi:hypothetical protein VZT92_003253 [Zoarces viviparus]|uniref:Uncharacterized protein n=1 Tax=Zoarces viviparus TaxID=48416 RepID=A0AAW1G0N2_ZOAVI